VKIKLAALRRCDVDLVEGRLRVPRKLAALRSGMAFGPPKSETGVRAVALPSVATTALRAHKNGDSVQDGQEALIFTGQKGALLRSGNFGRAVQWIDTVERLGLLSGFHVHDLRHTGNTLAAASGASTRELMHRMGQSSMRAALIYQHATSERDREIADGMDRRIAKQTRRSRKGQNR
jgi:integrase